MAACVGPHFFILVHVWGDFCFKLALGMVLKSWLVLQAQEGQVPGETTLVYTFFFFFFFFN